MDVEPIVHTGVCWLWTKCGGDLIMHANGAAIGVV